MFFGLRVHLDDFAHQDRLGALAQRLLGELDRDVDARRLHLQAHERRHQHQKIAGTTSDTLAPLQISISTMAAADAGPQATHHQLAPGS